MVRIRRFGVVRTATVVAVIYVLIIAISFIPVAVLEAAFGARGDGSAGVGLELPPDPDRVVGLDQPDGRAGLSHRTVGVAGEHRGRSGTIVRQGRLQGRLGRLG